MVGQGTFGDLSVALFGLELLELIQCSATTVVTLQQLVKHAKYVRSIPGSH